ncbi:MAG: hypothetical protein U1E71_13385 [Ramlibacter sp.]
MPYTVTLVNLENVSAAQREAMEQIFRATLEKLFGGPEGVVAAWQACLAEREAQKTDTFTLNAVTLGGAASRWDLMSAMARRTALEGWEGPADDVRFDVAA